MSRESSSPHKSYFYQGGANFRNARALQAARRVFLPLLWFFFLRRRPPWSVVLNAHTARSTAFRQLTTATARYSNPLSELTEIRQADQTKR
jgi:hypothetical protein